MSRIGYQYKPGIPCSNCSKNREELIYVVGAIQQYTVVLHAESGRREECHKIQHHVLLLIMTYVLYEACKHYVSY